MKLKAFRIQNFRSIVDTGYQDLSPDNITAIIGQNESGKTSILEGLTNFYNHNLSVDDIRTDTFDTTITCVFQFDNENEVGKIFNEYILDKQLKQILKDLDYCVAIETTWINSPNEEPVMDIDDDKLNQYFNDLSGKEQIEVVNEQQKTLGIDTFIGLIYDFAPNITLFEDKSLLPPTIDLTDLQAKNEKVDGYIGAKNFLELTGLSVDELFNHQKNERAIQNKIDAANKKISRDLQEYWSQILGTQDKISLKVEIKNYDNTTPAKIGQHYLSFWIVDNNGHLRPMQRSKGVRWYISFFLTLKATTKKKSNIGRVLLIDEPGANLHAKAQEDILKILESEKDKLQIIYATHSPYLLDIKKVYRVLAVERKENDNNQTETKVYKFHDLGSASQDTLFPLYTSMGIDISHQQVIQKANNVILEEISAFFYLQAFLKLFKQENKIYFLPATGCSNVPTLANLLLGWGISFSVVLDDDSHGRQVYKDLKGNYVCDEHNLIKIKDCDGIEDIFLISDFSKFVLNDASIKIPAGTKNSQFIKKGRMSKPLLARDFLLRVESDKIKKDDLSPKTQSDIQNLLDRIIASLS